MNSNWHFVDDEGTFKLENPEWVSHLYFPLVHPKGIMSSIAPNLNGDIKLGKDKYLTPPSSIENLHNGINGRDFLISIDDGSLFSIAKERGKENGDFRSALTAGFLWHQVERSYSEQPISTRILNFVPIEDQQIELMQVSIRNTSSESISLRSVASIPLFGRSLDNVFDHRHVTSLFNQVSVTKSGISLQPSIHFDETGHIENSTQYGVFARDSQGRFPIRLFPTLDGFMGEGGSLSSPALERSFPDEIVGESATEAHGGLEFDLIDLEPGEETSWFIVLAIGEKLDGQSLCQNYASPAKFHKMLENNRAYWKEKVNSIEVKTGDSQMDRWTSWVALQPILRSIMGNSFLPYHDYGRGGRGWRDLWQDSLASLLMGAQDLDDSLALYFEGVRLDGTNATIVSSEPGKFISDRNNIPRVWMDHALWPLFTVDLFLNLSGQFEFLLRENRYFFDHLTHRAAGTRTSPASSSSFHTMKSGSEYRGSIFEHLLVQHLTSFFNVGEHNFIRLEGADWNDGLDMAPERGESVAFSSFFVYNLQLLARYCDELIALGVRHVELLSELKPLLDRDSLPLDYSDIDQKRKRLESYLSSVSASVEGEKVAVNLLEIKRNLEEKASWLKAHIQQNEWIPDKASNGGWFNGYYDNDGKRVEGTSGQTVKMTLTGQVFSVLSGVAEDAQVSSIINSAKAHLWSSNVGGYRLNTDFGGNYLSLGRAFSFLFGHKENGSMFSHMAMMFAYALYERGHAEEGHEILETLYQQCQKFPSSKMYPGIPEYFGPDGRGYYFYLTGSASWYLLTLVHQSFGIKGYKGDLLIQPQLVSSQFDDEGRASIRIPFTGKPFTFVFNNPQKLPAGEYQVSAVSTVNGPVPFENKGDGALVGLSALTEISVSDSIQLELGKK